MKPPLSLGALFILGLVWSAAITAANAQGDVIQGDCSVNMQNVQAGGDINVNLQCVSSPRLADSADVLAAIENLKDILTKVQQDLASHQRDEHGASKTRVRGAFEEGDIRPAEQMYKTTINDSRVPELRRAQSAYELGNLYYSQLDYAKTRVAYQEAMRLDPKNGQYAYAMGTLLLWSLDVPKEAVEFFESALKLDRQQYGPDSDQVVRDLDDISNALRIVGEYDKAVDRSKEALEIELKKFGLFDPAVGDRYIAIGRALLAAGNYASALDYLDRAQQNYSAALPEEDIKLAYLWNYKGDALLEKGRTKKNSQETIKAETYYKKALNILLEHLPASNLWVSAVYENLGMAKAEQNQFADAIKYYDKALAINTKAYGKGHSAVAITWQNLAYAWYHLGNYGQAVHYGRLALPIFESVYGNDNLRTRQARETLASAEAALRTGH